MTRIILGLFLSASMFLGTYAAADELSIENYEITFISSGEDLAAALKAETKLRGLGVRYEFYVNGSKEVRARIDGLVFRIANKLIPVFIYGDSISVAVLEKWFPKTKKFLACKGPVAGVLATFILDENTLKMLTDERSGFTGSYMAMCVTGLEDLSESEFELLISDLSESGFRKLIDQFWTHERKDLKESGYATLN